jgi:hypothetical protein
VFNVQHYGQPTFDAAKHVLEVTGQVNRPLALTMDELKRRPTADQLMTLECSGNGSSKGFMSAVYNSKWTGTPLAGLLAECGVKPEAKEVVFIGVDKQEETLRKGTNREVTVEVPFGRSMWIELRDTRYMGRFMARDYVTLRGERHGDEIVYVETSVNRMNLKSIVARVTRRAEQDGGVPVKAYGAAWNDGTEIRKVEVKVDDGEWREARLDAEPRAKFSWVFFSIDLGKLPRGMHIVVSRASDASGRVQPSDDADEIALKKTYWEAYAQWPREIEL